ncbi:MAG: phosphate uptake regulator PhoU [Candidatus Pacearchaeota archaeon]|nr:MAG: phosphate uptake regulator PhoU [Candidatus Pacearchaeota archaeon]
METRKIIKFGNSSHIISIPKSWMKENKLKKGDVVYLKQNSNGELLVLPKERSDIIYKKAVIHATSKDMKLIQREILAAYIKGFNVLSVTAPNIKEKIPEIKKNLKQFIGIDIIDKNSKEIVAADFLDINNVSIKSIIRRIDNNVRSMFEDLQFCLDNHKINEKEFNEIYETDGDVNKFYFLLWKLTVYGLENPSILNKWGFNSVELTHTWWLGMNMERIGDELKRIARELKHKKFNRTTIKKILEIFIIIKKTYLDVMHSYYKKDIKLAYNASSKKEDIMKRGDSISANNLKVGKICEKLKSAQSYIHNMAKCTIYFT